MEQTELNKILEKHKLWIESNGVQGNCANLRDADLNGANLTGADLLGAYLKGANLKGANLWGANLRRANLTGANLTRANLHGADLTRADLTGANLTGADLTRAILKDANLKDAILPDISWIIPGCLVRLNQIKYSFSLEKERKWVNFVQDSFGFIIQDNREEKTFDMLAGDRIIRNVPHWVKYSGLKQIASESV